MSNLKTDILLGRSPGGLSVTTCDESDAWDEAFAELADMTLGDKVRLADNMVLHASTPPGLTFTFHGHLRGDAVSAKPIDWSDLERGDTVLLHPDDWGRLVSVLPGFMGRRIDVAGTTFVRDDNGVTDPGKGWVIKHDHGSACTSSSWPKAMYTPPCSS